MEINVELECEDEISELIQSEVEQLLADSMESSIDEAVSSIVYDISELETNKVDNAEFHDNGLAMCERIDVLVGRIEQLERYEDTLQLRIEQLERLQSVTLLEKFKNLFGV